MGRPPLPVGTFGKIDFLVLGKNRIRAHASFRDYDGHRRLVTRYGPTRGQAERRLREALRDRGTGEDPVGSATSRLSELAALWLAEVDDSELAWAPSGCTGSPSSPTSCPAWASCDCARSPCRLSTGCSLR